MEQVGQGGAESRPYSDAPQGDFFRFDTGFHAEAQGCGGKAGSFQQAADDPHPLPFAVKYHITLFVQAIKFCQKFFQGRVAFRNCRLLEDPESLVFRSGGKQKKFCGVFLQIPAVADEVSHFGSRRVAALKDQIPAVAVRHGEIDHPAAEFGREFPKRFCGGGSQSVATGCPAAVGGECRAAGVAGPARTCTR